MNDDTNQETEDGENMDASDFQEGIAIIGLAGRFPGAMDVAAFWENITQGVESIARLTEEQLQAAGIPSDLLTNPQYVKARPVLEGVDQFDASFFGITPHEARVTDPQQRVFLECAWSALEDAGIAVDQYPGAIGVYAGFQFEHVSAP